uniref:Uncharacterized protein n=1 Tax=Haptolina brevifila TaxID=156173 RepID=A0A7S2HQU2_9EUKA|mmetsp:Transcript_57040/g.113319  ORF Transcript_57040/g.113319 Transcript_57040/m.113319 type:complete len:129 (+) Transcript_57040:66-452(+)|eukprot:CAMPEP_0174717124 /NCGR_PEP_ID=MMETSP1094-20130205/25938_1 /TAXON_ID=156173 /ORGANISM="Chrysochromulina brevifilum, Strain UTEX LB 985" /LENGTH=128 /DNA_ID=CAMNT_0015917017 /DNA_START=65 /DNA_END=451 /DNA_ORIENTATION=-
MAPKKEAAPEPPPEPTGPFWFTVKHSDAQTGLFNADCWAVVLLDYIKETCGYGDLAEPVDLQKEDGTCVGLMALGKGQANTVLEPKGIYILCKVIPSEDGSSPPQYESLWTPPEGYEPPPPPAAGKKK